MSVLDKVRKWIDGETAEGVLEEAARDAQVKPRSQAEEFIVKIARYVEEVIQRELVSLPQGTAIIPTEYTIFLSEEDDKEWQGAKRRGLEQGLYHILSERALEIAGRKKLENETFAVKFRVDGTLQKGDLRVHHSWEDPSHPKTQVLKREDIAGAIPPVAGPGTSEVPEPIQFAPPSSYPVQQQPSGRDDMTQVVARHAVLYKLEIWREGTRVNVVPVTTLETVVGRGSSTKPVDISLPGDAEVSRRHLQIITDGSGSFWMINEGRNPASINGMELQTGLRVKVPAGTPVAVCSYVLRVQPQESRQ